jgi:hypothetical protein
VRNCNTTHTEVRRTATPHKTDTHGESAGEGDYQTQKHQDTRGRKSALLLNGRPGGLTSRPGGRRSQGAEQIWLRTKSHHLSSENLGIKQIRSKNRLRRSASASKKSGGGGAWVGLFKNEKRPHATAIPHTPKYTAQPRHKMDTQGESTGEEDYQTQRPQRHQYTRGR